VMIALRYVIAAPLLVASCFVHAAFRPQPLFRFLLLALLVLYGVAIESNTILLPHAINVKEKFVYVIV